MLKGRKAKKYYKQASKDRKNVKPEVGYFYQNGWYIAFDNSTKELWVEDCRTEEDAIKFCKNE